MGRAERRRDDERVDRLYRCPGARRGEVGGFGEASCRAAVGSLCARPCTVWDALHSMASVERRDFGTKPNLNKWFGCFGLADGFRVSAELIRSIFFVRFCARFGMYCTVGFFKKMSSFPRVTGEYTSPRRFHVGMGVRRFGCGSGVCGCRRRGNKWGAGVNLVEGPAELNGPEQAPLGAR